MCNELKGRVFSEVLTPFPNGTINPTAWYVVVKVECEKLRLKINLFG